MTRLVHVVGTRPNFVKMAPVTAALAEHGQRESKQDGEEQNLQDLALGERADDGAALVFRERTLQEVVAARPHARAYEVDDAGERALEARRATRGVTVATRDGSVGLAGTVADVLPDLLERTGAEVVYAAGGPKA